MSARAGDALLVRLAEFGRVLRAGGLAVGPSRLLTALEALAAVDLHRREDVRWALRCSLVTSPEEGNVFDAAFPSFWEDDPFSDVASALERPEHDRQTGDSGAEVASGNGSENGDPAPAPAQQVVATDDEITDGRAAWSAQERLRRLDFMHYGEDELRAARRMLERGPQLAPMRRSSRLEPARRGRRLDPRATLRATVRAGGDPVQPHRRRPRQVRRRLVFLVDVSGSMEPYARAMVMFLQAAVAGGRNVEAFTFGTRLTRLTPYVRHRHPDRALRHASLAVPDWAGGTRIGDNLAAFNERWGRRGLTRGAVVVIFSDGWERGDTGLLAREMERLQRMAHRLVWVNPLSGDPRYEPLAAGMAAALPFVDVFHPGHDLASLEALADLAFV
jgi:uncharacterized protein with von Willebrand factor type A (vWA) domain